MDRTLRWLGKLLGKPFIYVGLLWFVSIWPISHWLSAPGGQVRVYMGLSEYTKEYPAAFEPVREKLVRSPPRLVASGVTKTAGAAGALRAFRDREQLRELSPLETGKVLDKMPIGTFGYVSGFLLDPQVKRMVAESEVMDSGKPPGTQFEVQKNYAGDLAVLAYLTPSDSARAMAQDMSQREIILFPRPWKGACDLVFIPEGALYKAGSRIIRDDDGKDIRVIDAVLGIPGNR